MLHASLAGDGDFILALTSVLEDLIAWVSRPCVSSVSVKDGAVQHKA